MKKHNFSAGPCILPQQVLEKASQAVLNFNNSNLSLIEISHRSNDFVAVMDKAQALVKELLKLPDGYSVLFLQGGASTQFLMTAMNLLKISGKAAYINTGTWSTKALKEAKRYGEINIIASSEDKNFSYIPKDYSSQKIQTICTSHQITRSLEHNFMNFQKFQKTQCWSVTCHQIFSQEKLMFRNLI